MGPNGEIVVPKTILDAVGIAPGDEVAFEVDGQELLMRKVEHPLESAPGERRVAPQD